MEQLSEQIAGTLEHVTGLRIQVTLVEPSTIPRSEGKAKRVVDRRAQS
jgi:phenylacetate-CoA ligase